MTQYVWVVLMPMMGARDNVVGVFGSNISRDKMNELFPPEEDYILQDHIVEFDENYE